tara:strand:- start:3102 stop:3254 length:153 start_codon:yes stop_codon:yes gene_type:complete
MLADRLKKSLEEVMQLSVLELDLWLGYMSLETQETNKKIRTEKAQRKFRR